MCSGLMRQMYTFIPYGSPRKKNVNGVTLQSLVCLFARRNLWVVVHLENTLLRRKGHSGLDMRWGDLYPVDQKSHPFVSGGRGDR
jgi:hypothetical protein